MVTLSIKTDFKSIEDNLKKLEFSLRGKVVSAALNKVAAKAKTEMSRAITSEFNLNAGEVKRNLRVIPAKRNLRNWFVILDPFASSRKGRSLNLIRFLKSAKKSKKLNSENQLLFKIKRSSPPVTLRGAFIGNQGRTVFGRVEGRYIKNRINKKGNSKHAEAIEAKQTINIAQMFNTRRINARVVARIRQELPIEFERAIKAALAGNIR